MADITFDSKGTGSPSYGTNQTVGSPVVASQSNRILIAFWASTNQNDVTGMAYNGAALSSAPMGGVYRGSVWYLLNPDIGTHTLTSTTGGGSGTIYVNWYVFYNVNQTSPWGPATDNEANSNNCTAGPLSPTYPNCVLLATCGGNNGSAGTPDSPCNLQTSNQNRVGTGISAVLTTTTAQSVTGHSGSGFTRCGIAYLQPLVLGVPSGNFFAASR